MMCKNSKCNSICKDTGSLMIRLGLAIIFIMAGAGKFMGGIDAFGEKLVTWGIPLPGVMKYLIPLVELLGGIFMLMGWFTCIFGFLLALIMLGAFVMVKKFNLQMGMADIALFFMALGAAFGGPGKFMIPCPFCKKCKKCGEGGCEKCRSGKCETHQKEMGSDKPAMDM